MDCYFDFLHDVFTFSLLHLTLIFHFHSSFLHFLRYNTQMNKHCHHHGFTLVELMVVIAIISILTSIITTSFSTARSKARDAKRISDLGHIQLALELYYDRCKEYPTTSPLDINDNNGCPPGITLGTFISKIPTTPVPASGIDYLYDYAVDDSNGSQDYILQIHLENNNDPRLFRRQRCADSHRDSFA